MTERRTTYRSGRLGRTLSVLLLIVAALGLAAPYLASTWIEFDVLSHVRLHFIGVALVAFIALFFRRLWPLILLAGHCAIPIVVAVVPSLTEQPDTRVETVDGEVPLKVLTYNTWFQNDDWPALEAYLRKEDADIVVMMEFGPSKLPLLEKLQTLYPYQADCIDVGNCYLVLLSKKPFDSSGHRKRWPGPPIIWAKFGEELSGLTVIGTHLSRSPFAATQLRHVTELAREALKLGNPMIVAGDFNATEWSLTIAEFQSVSGLQRVTRNPTWPTFFFGLPQLGIDHIFISNGVRALTGSRRGDDVGSDHLPMSVRLAITSS